MAAVTICSAFGAQENKVCHCFHCFPIYFGKSEDRHFRNQQTKMDWNAKVGSQETPGVTGKLPGRAKANRVLPRESTGHSKHPLPTTQEKTLHGHLQMVNTEIRLIIFFASKDGEALYSQQKQDRSDHGLLIAKFRLKLTKVWKTTRPSRYDLNQIPYDYTVEVRNRFKGLD